MMRISRPMVIFIASRRSSNRVGIGMIMISRIDTRPKAARMSERP